MLAAAVDSVEALQVLLKNGATVELQVRAPAPVLLQLPSSSAILSFSPYHKVFSRLFLSVM